MCLQQIPHSQTISLETDRWGDHYWMLDVDMDCSQTEGGWFEVKAFLTNDGKSFVY
jgi:hypothetical protein